MKIKNFHKICKYVELPLSKIKKFELILKPHHGNLFLIGGVVRCLILEKKNFVITWPGDRSTNRVGH